MKRLAIFCDGTWNRPDAQNPTNVYWLHKATLQTALNGMVQLPKYIPGVGTGFGMTGVAKTWDKVRGGLFGAGVVRNIMTGYRFLAEQYEPGDEIYIFGFSRGAFTARSLAGLIRSSGLPPNDLSYRVPEAMRRYRQKFPWTEPGHDRSHRFRLEFSPDVATSQQEVDWRVANGHPRPHLLTITYVGVWDTVSAMGVPGHYQLLAGIFNGGHRFHDTMLSRSVKAARHAVSIDEARKTFPPTLWENLGALNQAETDRARVYRQEWFPGDHGSVGGGGDIRGLSNIALRWVAEGAAQEGLDFNWVALNDLMQDEDPTAALYNRSKPPGLMARLMRINRLDRPSEFQIPTWQISQAARDRHDRIPHYRPELF